MNRVHKDKFVQLSLDVFDTFRVDVDDDDCSSASGTGGPSGPQRRRSSLIMRGRRPSQVEVRSLAREAARVARDPAPRGPLVDGLEVLLMLALFCKGEVSEQLQLCFKMFDADDNDVMDQQEMLHFLTVLGSGSYKMRVIPLEPPQREVLRLARQMFKAANVHEVEGGVCAADFVRWARENVVSTAIMDSVKALRLAAAPEHERFLSEKLERLRQKRAATKSMMAGLTKTTNFNVAELKFLRKAFARKLGVKPEDLNSDEVTLTQEQFIDVMKSEYPAFADDESTARLLFGAFDTDSGGSIDFREFSVGMSKLTKGTLMEKITFLFDVYDEDGSGSISCKELLKFVQREQGELVDELKFTEELIAALDQDGDGTVSRLEFTSALRDDSVLAECFHKALVVPAITRDVVRQFRNSGCAPTLTYTDLKRWWERGFGVSTYELAKLGGRCARSGVSCTRDQFREVACEEMQSEEGTEHGWDILWDIQALRADAPAPGKEQVVDWTSLFEALAQVAEGEVDEKATLYFTIHDTDGSGDMDSNEIMRLIMSSQEAMNDNAAKVLKLLKTLDNDGDGEITFDEFKGALQADPATLEILGHFFGHSETTEDDEEKALRLKQEELERVVSEVKVLFQPTRDAPDGDGDEEKEEDAGAAMGLAVVAATNAMKMQKKVLKARAAKAAAAAEETPPPKKVVYNSAGKRVVTKAERGPTSAVGQGLAKLRRLSLGGLATAVSALQGLTVDAQLQWRTTNDIDDLPQYTLPPASIAAKELVRTISSSIDTDKKELERLLRLEEAQSKYDHGGDAGFMAPRSGLRVKFSGVASPSTDGARSPVAALRQSSRSPAARAPRSPVAVKSEAELQCEEREKAERARRRKLKRERAEARRRAREDAEANPMPALPKSRAARLAGGVGGVEALEGLSPLTVAFLQRQSPGAAELLASSAMPASPDFTTASPLPPPVAQALELGGRESPTSPVTRRAMLRSHRSEASRQRESVAYYAPSRATPGVATGSRVGSGFLSPVKLRRAATHGGALTVHATPPVERLLPVHVASGRHSGRAGPAPATAPRRDDVEQLMASLRRRREAQSNGPPMPESPVAAARARTRHQLWQQTAVRARTSPQKRPMAAHRAAKHVGAETRELLRSYVSSRAMQRKLEGL